MILIHALIALDSTQSTFLEMESIKPLIDLMVIDCEDLCSELKVSKTFISSKMSAEMKNFGFGFLDETITVLLQFRKAFPSLINSSALRRRLEALQLPAKGVFRSLCSYSQSPVYVPRKTTKFNLTQS